MGGPFGASVVRDGVLISCAHNMVLHRSDPCCHAEMNAIQQACKAIGSHDLSDCELYTTCEPCPMCWGAVQWSWLRKAYIGVDRHTAAKYGFDDKVFYDEIDAKAGHFGIRREGYLKDSGRNPDKQPDRVQKNMVDVYDGILEQECLDLFLNPDVNKTLKRRFSGPGGDKLLNAYKHAFKPADVAKREPPSGSEDRTMNEHEEFMRRAVRVALRGVKEGQNKEKEPFGAVIVKNGNVIAEGYNTVLSGRDATATAEINAIRSATVLLGTYNLEGCDLYTTAHPDLMSLGAVLWSRIGRIYCGVSQQTCAQCGFEEGFLQLQDLLEVDPKQRITDVTPNVAMKECEAVFREWSDRNGVIY